MATPAEDSAGRGWTGTGRATVRLWRIYLFFLRVFGRFPIYLSMWVTSFVFFLKTLRERDGLEAYMDRRWSGMGRWQRHWTVWRIYYNYALALIDRFIVLAKGPQAFRFIKEDETEAARLMKAPDGIVFLTCHLGNPEVLGAAVHGDVGRKSVSLVRYNARNDPYSMLLKTSETQHTPNFIALNDGRGIASFEIIKSLRRGDLVGFLGDRVVDQRTAEVPFMGGTISLPTGPFLIAGLAKVPVVALTCFKDGPFLYRLLASEPMEVNLSQRKDREGVLKDCARRYASQMERWVQRYPLQWYNFHNIWDPSAMALIQAERDAYQSE